MASWKPEIYDPNEVLAYYVEADAVTFRCYAGTKPDPAYLRYAFEETDMGMKQDGESILRAALEKIKSNAMNTNPYLLEVVHKAKGKGQKAVTTNITFQINFPAAIGYGNGQIGGGVSPELVSVLKGIAETNNLILSKLNGAEAGEEETEVLTGVHKNPLMGMIERPEIQNVLAQALGQFLGKVLNLNGKETVVNNFQKPQLNGINMQDEKCMQAIEILKKHDPEIGDSLLKLAALAQTNPDYFKQLITMLKTM